MPMTPRIFGITIIVIGSWFLGVSVLTLDMSMADGIGPGVFPATVCTGLLAIGLWYLIRG